MRIPRNHNPSLTSIPNMGYEYLKNSLENRAARKEARQRFWLFTGSIIAWGVVIWTIWNARG